MTMRELILGCTNEEYQMIHECAVSARLVKARKGAPAHTRLEIATQHFTPNALLNPALNSHVGVLVWIPTEEYQRLAKGEK